MPYSDPEKQKAAMKKIQAKRKEQNRADMQVRRQREKANPELKIKRIITQLENLTGKKVQLIER